LTMDSMTIRETTKKMDIYIYMYYIHIYYI
jgi:hypothetical protein